MREDEIERQQRVLDGYAAVANLRTDKSLISWGESTGRYVYVGRPGEWGNPYEIGRDGNRDDVCNLHSEWLQEQHDLLARIGELKGKVLTCWCAPLRCHGDTLAHLANAMVSSEPSHGAG